MTLDDIKKTIETAVPQSQAFIFDPNNDGQHLQAIVVSPNFEGMMLIKQHQLVMKPLKDAFAGALHALALKTLTPAQWEEFKLKNNIQKV